MKVAVLLRTFPTLSETFVLNQITGLMDRGCQVTIFAHHRGSTARPAEVELYKLLDRTVYSPPLPASRLGRGIQAVEHAVTCFAQAPATVSCAVTAWRRASRAAACDVLSAATRHLPDSDKFDIVHCHFGRTGLTGAFLRRAGLLRGPLLTTFYGYDVTSLPKRWGRRCYAPLFDSAETVLALSESMRERLIAMGAPRDRCEVHHIGVNVDSFTPSGSVSKSSDPSLRLLAVARLVEKKGIEFAIRAVHEARKAGMKVQFRIVGDGPLRPQLESLAAQLGLSRNVCFLGARSNEEVVDEMGRADVFVLPSVRGSDGDEEGTPTVLMEAMACCLPVVSTWHSGIPEVVEEGRSGFLVPERDVGALAHRLLLLLENPDLRRSFGAHGRSRVKAEFNISRLNDRLVRRYEKLRSCAHLDGPATGLRT